MKVPLAERGRLIGAVVFAALVTVLSGPAMAEEGEWETIFDGKTLEGWEGNPGLLERARRGHYRTNHGGQTAPKATRLSFGEKAKSAISN